MPVERGYDILAPNDRETEEEIMFREQKERWYNEFGQKRCMSCGEYKDLSEFGNKATTWDKRQYSCKDCCKRMILESRLRLDGDFDLADKYNVATQRKQTIVAELIRRADSGWYD